MSGEIDLDVGYTRDLNGERRQRLLDRTARSYALTTSRNDTSTDQYRPRFIGALHAFLRGVERMLRSTCGSRRIFRGAWRVWLRAGEIGQRGVDTATLMRDATGREAHFHPAERSTQSEVIEKAQMADAKYPAKQASQSHPEGHVVARQHVAPESVRIVSFRPHDRGQRAAVFRGVAAKEIEPPRPHCATRRLGMAIVARKHIGEALLEEHFDRFVQAVEKVRRGRVREIALAVRRDNLVPAPIRPG